MAAPTHGGQAVRFTRTGELGITTDAPAVRTPTVPVQFVGRSYPVRCQLSDLERVEIEVSP